ncbi:MAG: flagellar brake protein [Betaproteobacteria bacterium]|nr:flagellar brake protein [Betaproteobacteria bacterium]
MGDHIFEDDARTKTLRLEVQELKKILQNEVLMQKKALLAKAIEQREAQLRIIDAPREALRREEEEKRQAQLKEAAEQRKAMLRIELAQTEEDSKYHLHAQAEIVAILRSLKDSNATVTLYFNDGDDFLITSVFTVEEEENRIVLHMGANAAVNKHALTTDKLIGVSHLDKIRVQFVLHGLKSALYRGRQCFLADLPDSVLRLQRREYFRLTIPARSPVKCRIPLPVPEGGNAARTVEVDVIDISGGGLGMVVPPEDVEFNVDMVFQKCEIELPSGGTIVTALRVRSIFDVTRNDGTTSRRAGCDFINFGGPMLSMLQRYIIVEERERKAREAGLA